MHKAAGTSRIGYINNEDHRLVEPCGRNCVSGETEPSHSHALDGPSIRNGHDQFPSKFPDASMVRPGGRGVQGKGSVGRWAAISPLVLPSRRARSQDHQRPGPTYFPVEVAQRYLDEISRDIPAKLLLLSAKFAVELADLERRMAPRKPLPATWQAGFAARDSH
jgi:hypothetical protein